MSFWSRDPVLSDAIAFDPFYFFFTGMHIHSSTLQSEFNSQFNLEIVILSNVTRYHRAKCHRSTRINMGIVLSRGLIFHLSRLHYDSRSR
jgi:hypothetical protein